MKLNADVLRRWRCEHLPEHLGQESVSQTEAAARVGVTKQSWYRWEKGWTISEPYQRLILMAMQATGFKA